MSILIPSTHKLEMALFRYLSLFILLIMIGLSQAQAQTTSTTKKTTDGTTPAGLEPGAPAGSYALSDFDNINLFSQSMNFRLPLMKIGGRGSAGYQMMLPIERKWHVDHTTTMSGLGCQSCDEFIVTHSYMPNDSWWNGIQPGYGPGVLQGRSVGSRDYLPGCFHDTQVYRKTLTRLTFTTPDGTEYELRDKLTNGQPLTVPSCTTSPNRGKVFVSTDGTSLTFVSDTAIEDYISVNDYPPSKPSGYLLLNDGTRYRIDNGEVSWIRDRNGNTLHYYPNVQLSNGQYGTRIVDSLNREVTVTYANTTGAYDEITYKGFGGAPRVIRVWYGALSDNLRPANAEHPAEVLSSYLGLFPVQNSQDATYNPKVISRVELPDASLKYKFYYNSYGELARVELPTGGAFEYDYQQSSGLYNLGGDEQNGDQYEIFRQVIERRVYNTGGALETRMTYGACQGATGTPPFTCVEADQRDPSDSSRILEASRHYFSGSPYPKMAWYDPLYYTGWNEGKEYKTEKMAAGGLNVLRRVEKNWQQRAPVSWWTGTCCLGPEPANDPRVIETINTLVDTSQVSKQSAINPSTHEVGFDQYNNQTDNWEYDFGASGSGEPGLLLRHTHTDFLTVNSINGKAYDALILNNSNLDLSNTIHLRSLPLGQSLYDANGVEQARTTYEYDNYASDSHHAAILAYPSPAISGMDSAFTSSSGALARGNATATTQYLISNNSVTGSVTAYQQYDVAGNVVKAVDPLNHTTMFEFSDRFGIADNEAETNSAPTELAGLMTYAFATKAINALGHTTHTQFDYYLSKAVNVEDANQAVMSRSYDDLLDRPTQAIHYTKPLSGNPVAVSQMTFSYDNSNHIITTTSDQITYGDNLIKSQMLYDGLGRTIETRQFETATSYIAVKQIPYLLDQDPQSNRVRASRASNPYRPAEESPVYTTTYFDALGRVTAVKSPDNAIVSTSYSGSQILVADQAAKQRLSQSNALGQLTDVWEITPNDATKYPGISSLSFNGQSLQGYLTHYEYDLLDDLIKVTQGMQPQRTFAYNSLKQLTDATNPENGHISYDYDAAGNLRHRMDARNTTTTYDYDELSRLKSKTYNDAGITPSVFYKYDAQTLPAEPQGYDRGSSIGRLVAVLYGNANSTTGNYKGYDALGRIKCSYQVTYDGTASQTYGFPDYEYDLAGNLKSQVYPSGRIVTTNYDRAGRISNITGPGRSTPYADSFAYVSQGAVKEMKFGNGLWEHTIFNNRLQPTEISLGTQQTGQNSADRLKLTYSYESLDSNNQPQHDNNGNTLSQTIDVPAVGATNSFIATQTYTYDALNRLDSAKEMNAGGQTWKQVYSYDRYGNRNFGAGTTIPSLRMPQLTDPLTNPVINPSNNQLYPSAIGQGNIIYDAAGNLTRDVSGHIYAYDGENHQTQYDGGNPPTGGTNYSYDGEGRRVRKEAPAGMTVFVYNALGQMVAEYSNSSSQGDSNSGGTSYLTTDNLGTPRIITGTNINDAQGGVRARHDYLPFGEEIGDGIGQRLGPGHVDAQQHPIAHQGYVYGSGVGDNQRQKFTGKERDLETGLDYFGARYYAASHARFTSCDPVNFSQRHLVNPQRWNLYLYVNDNPLALVDPDGREPQGKGGGRVIDVFITLENKDLKMNWRGLEKMADRLRTEGKIDVTVHLYTLDAGQVNPERVQRSLTTPGRFTVIIGHSYLDDTHPGRPGEGVEIGGNGGYLGTFGITVRGPDGNGVDSELPTIRAAALMVVTCYPGQGFIETIENKLGPNSVAWYNNAGIGGRTSVATGEKAGFEMVKALILGKSPEQAAAAAQNVLEHSTNPTDQDNDSMVIILPRGPKSLEDRDQR